MIKSYREKALLNKIFLHFGPGANASIEKEFLADPTTHYWNQPKVSSPNYIEDLLRDTSEEIKKLASDSKGKIEIIAHSFGVFLAQNLDEKTRSLVSKAVYLAPTFDFRRSITNMMSFVANDSSIKNINSFEEFLSAFVSFSTNHPDYFKYYFHQEENFQKYIKLAQKYESTHEASLMAGIKELMNTYANQAISPKYDNTKVILGKYDPLVPKADQDLISSVFEHTEIVDAGHFPHLEKRIIF